MCVGGGGGGGGVWLLSCKCARKSGDMDFSGALLHTVNYCPEFHERI